MKAGIEYNTYTSNVLASDNEFRDLVTVTITIPSSGYIHITGTTEAVSIRLYFSRMGGSTD